MFFFRADLFLCVSQVASEWTVPPLLAFCQRLIFFRVMFGFGKFKFGKGWLSVGDSLALHQGREGGATIS